MNSVLLGVDFVATEDEIILLELNTDINISFLIQDYFELSKIFDYISDNNFTTLRIIYKKEFISNSMILKIQEQCMLNNVTYDEIIIPSNSVTIPSYEDNDTTLNLRFAYNSQAIIDDTYCRDKNELVNILFENQSEDIIPKTYTVHNGTVLDSLTTISDNGIIPNLIAKKQLPDFSKSKYPEFYNVNDLTELDTIKSNLPNGILLQEYKYSPLNVEEGVITNHIRQWYLVTNQLTEIIDCGGYIHSNQININESYIQYDNLVLDNIARNMFFSNPNKSLNEGIPSTYEIDKQLEDGSFSGVTASDINIGDVVRALTIDTLNYDYTMSETVNWEYTGNTDNLLSYTTATVISVINKQVNDWFNRITYTDGTNIGSSLLPTGKLVLTEKDGVVKFKIVHELTVGDFIFNTPNSKSTITSIDNEYFSGSMTMIDIEPSDVFIAGTSENEILNTIVVHNRCRYSKV